MPGKMKETEKSPILKKTKINLKLLPIKLHYALYVGGVAGVIPYIPVMGMDLGINATAIGTTFTVLYFASCFFKAMFGALADYLGNLKGILICLNIVSAISLCMFLFIPLLPETSEHLHVVIERIGNSSRLVPSLVYNSSCVKDFTKGDLNCYVSINKSQNYMQRGKYKNMIQIKSIFPYTYNNKNDHSKNTKQSSDKTTASNSSLRKYVMMLNASACESPWNSCVRKEKPNINVYTTLQFWAFFILAFISGITTESVFSLSDSACYEVLGDQTDNFGVQLIWSTVSWGIISILSGILNNWAVKETTSVMGKYAPGIYLMVAMLLLDLVLLCKTTLKKASMSSSICKDIQLAYASSEVIIFTVSVFISGVFTALVFEFEFIYFEELGADQLLLGLMMAVQCLLAQVPIYYFADRIVLYLGYFNCIIITFAAFSVRFALYSLLQNPWTILPVELFHGITFGLFYVTMNSYARFKAPPGTEATMIGIFSGVFEGLGLGTGCLIGGIGFDKVGGKRTFLIASILSALCVFIFLIPAATYKKKKHEQYGKLANDNET